MSDLQQQQQQTSFQRALYPREILLYYRNLFPLPPPPPPPSITPPTTTTTTATQEVGMAGNGVEEGRSMYLGRSEALAHYSSWLYLLIHVVNNSTFITTHDFSIFCLPRTHLTPPTIPEGSGV